jgi:hypothetical protein
MKVSCYEFFDSPERIGAGRVHLDDGNRGPVVRQDSGFGQ